MKEDVRTIIGAGIAVAFLAWAVVYTTQIGDLVQIGTGGLASTVHALEPPSIAGGAGVAGGAGSFTPSTVMPTSQFGFA